MDASTAFRNLDTIHQHELNTSSTPTDNSPTLLVSSCTKYASSPMKEDTKSTETQNNVPKKRKRASLGSLSDSYESAGSSETLDDSRFLLEAEIPALKKPQNENPENQAYTDADATPGHGEGGKKEKSHTEATIEEGNEEDAKVIKMIVRPYVYHIEQTPEDPGVTAHLEVVFLASAQRKASSILKKRRFSGGTSTSCPVELVPSQTLESLRKERLSLISEWMKACTLTVHQGHIMANAFVRKFQGWFDRGEIYEDLTKIMKRNPNESLSMLERKRRVHSYLVALPLEDWNPVIP